jgi:hypothetical protein
MSTVQDPAGAGAANVIPADAPPVLAGKKALIVTVSNPGGGAPSTVVGPDAPGAPATGNPVLTAAVDASGNVETIKVDDDGDVMSTPEGLSTSGYWPDNQQEIYALGPRERNPLLVDASGNLKTRGPVTTEEAAFRDDFEGTNIATALSGTVTFALGSNIVVGLGTSFTTEVTTDLLIKNSVDGDSFYVGINAVLDDTHLEMSGPYAGTMGAGAIAVVTAWSILLGVDGAVVVGVPPASSSICAIISGVTPLQTVCIYRELDYGTLVAEMRMKLSARRADKFGFAGLFDTPVSPQNLATLIFDGVDPTQVKLSTSNSSATVETTIGTLPGGMVTGDYHIYRIEIAPGAITAYCDGMQIAQNVLHLPKPYAVLNAQAGWTLGAGPVVSDYMLVDAYYGDSFNVLSIGSSIANAPVAAQILGVDEFGNKVPIPARQYAPIATDPGLLVRPVGVTPINFASHNEVATDVVGANFVLLNAAGCQQATILNNTGVDLEVQRNGAGVTLPVLDGSFWTFRGITNANQIGVRRMDLVGTPVTVKYELEG